MTVIFRETELYRELRGRLPRIDARDAPVGARFNPTDGTVAERVPCDLRLYEGRWWRAMADTGFPFQGSWEAQRRLYFGLSLAPVWEGTLQQADLESRVRPYGPMTGLRDADRPNVPASENCDAESYAALAADAAARFLSSAIFVSGVLHCACGGPVIVARRHGSWGPAIKVTSASDVVLLGGTALLGPSRRDEALELARHGRSASPVFPEWLLLADGIPARDDTAEAPAEAVHEFLASCAGTNVGLVSAEALDLIVQLRAMVDARSYDYATVHAVLNALHETAGENRPKAIPAPDSACNLRSLREWAWESLFQASGFTCLRLALDAPASAADEECLGLWSETAMG